MTLPETPGGTRREASCTSSAFLPKMTFSRRSSGVSCCSPLGVTLPTRMSPWATLVEGMTMPCSSRASRASAPTLGMSRVISSAPSLVSRASTSNSVMWIEVKRSSLTSRSEMQDGVLEVVALPGHEAHQEVAAQGQHAPRGARPVGQHVAGLDAVAGLDRGRLVDAGVLVGAAVLAQREEVDGAVSSLTPSAWTAIRSPAE